jgi:hypothetical protein
MGKFTNPNTGAELTMGADEAFLFSYAETVINPTAATLALNALTSDQTSKTAYPSTALPAWCGANPIVMSGPTRWWARSTTRS